MTKITGTNTCIDVELDGRTARIWEWNYIKNKMNIDEFDVDDVLIYREDGFWYVEK